MTPPRNAAAFGPVMAARAGDPPCAPFALLRSCARDVKPLAFTSIAALARHIHAARGQEGLELADVTLWRGGDAVGHAAVTVWTQSESGGRNRWLGYAWLSGDGRRALQAALYALAPETADRAEAA